MVQWCQYKLQAIAKSTNTHAMQQMYYYKQQTPQKREYHNPSQTLARQIGKFQALRELVLGQRNHDIPVSVIKATITDCVSSVSAARDEIVLADYSSGVG